MSALDVQEGGNHYKQMPIQPIEYTVKNKLGFIEGNIVKYITRHKFKNGAEDVRKVIHYCQLLLELEYGETLPTPTPQVSPEEEELFRVSGVPYSVDKESLKKICPK